MNDRGGRPPPAPGAMPIRACGGHENTSGARATRPALTTPKTRVVCKNCAQWRLKTACPQRPQEKEPTVHQRQDRSDRKTRIPIHRPFLAACLPARSIQGRPTCNQLRPDPPFQAATREVAPFCTPARLHTIGIPPCRRLSILSPDPPPARMLPMQARTIVGPADYRR